MSELTATVAETRANFSRIAAHVNKSGKPVTVFKNSKPWVVIAPVKGSAEAPIPLVDWSKVDVKEPHAEFGYVILPQDTFAEEDEGLYDDLV